MSQKEKRPASLQALFYMVVVVDLKKPLYALSLLRLVFYDFPSYQQRYQQAIMAGILARLSCA